MSKLLPSSAVIIIPAFVWVIGGKTHKFSQDNWTVAEILTQDIRINQC
jgi:hypothetical protein